MVLSIHTECEISGSDMMTNEKYQNRHSAGQILAGYLQAYKNRQDAIVLALPRGGVPVAYEVANSLHLPLDLFIVRKLGVPGHEELAFGALTHQGTTLFNQDIIDDLNITQEMMATVIAKETIELKRRERVYRGNKPFPDISDKTIILVDDGIATGASMRVAIKALHAMHAAHIVVAVPVAEEHLSMQLAQEVDLLICPQRPVHFFAVGHWYEDFAQTEDEEVHDLMRKSPL